MSLCDSVLRILDEKRGERVSGEELGSTLGVSRAAVWKAVRELRRDGVRIDAAPHGGYTISPDVDILTADKIASRLRGNAASLDVRLYRTLESTNSTARLAAENGEQGPAVFIAEEQTKGRGRETRRFHSPAGGGIYMSILLRPKLSPADTLCLTTAAAVAVAEAIERVSGKRAGIKWVNDVFIDCRKVCGILTEASLSIESGSVDYAVVGIGINASLPKGGFAPEIRSIAGAVCEKETTDLRARLAAEVLNIFCPLADRLSDREFFDEYRSRLFFLGESVTVLRGEERYVATALDIDRDFRLVVRREDGSEEALSSGEISIKLA